MHEQVGGGLYLIFDNSDALRHPSWAWFLSLPSRFNFRWEIFPKTSYVCHPPQQKMSGAPISIHLGDLAYSRQQFLCRILPDAGSLALCLPSRLHHKASPFSHARLGVKLLRPTSYFGFPVDSREPALHKQISAGRTLHQPCRGDNNFFPKTILDRWHYRTL